MLRTARIFARMLRWLVRFFAKKNNLPFWKVVFHYFSRLSDLNQLSGRWRRAGSLRAPTCAGGAIRGTFSPKTLRTARLFGARTPVVGSAGIKKTASRV